MRKSSRFKKDKIQPVTEWSGWRRHSNAEIKNNQETLNAQAGIKRQAIGMKKKISLFGNVQFVLSNKKE